MFQYPKCLAFHNEKLYVVDMYNNRIQIFTHDGKFLFTFGKFGHDFGEFACPTYIAISAFDEIFVADKENKRIQIFDEMGAFLRCCHTITNPMCISIDSSGYLLVSAYKNVHVFK